MNLMGLYLWAYFGQYVVPESDRRSSNVATFLSVIAFDHNPLPVLTLSYINRDKWTVDSSRRFAGNR